MFNYKKFSLPTIFTTFFSYSTYKTESPCANSRYSQCLDCFSYLLPAVETDLQSDYYQKRSHPAIVDVTYILFFCLPK